MNVDKTQPLNVQNQKLVSNQESNKTTDKKGIRLEDALDSHFSSGNQTPLKIHSEDKIVQPNMTSEEFQKIHGNLGVRFT